MAETRRTFMWVIRATVAPVLSGGRGEDVERKNRQCNGNQRLRSVTHPNEAEIQFSSQIALAIAFPVRILARHYARAFPHELSRLSRSRRPGLKAVAAMSLN